MTKEVLLNLRVRADVREEFKIAAELRGATMSGLLHQFIYKTIREEKTLNPKLFEAAPTPNPARAAPTLAPAEIVAVEQLPSRPKESSKKKKKKAK